MAKNKNKVMTEIKEEVNEQQEPKKETRRRARRRRGLKKVIGIAAGVATVVATGAAALFVKHRRNKRTRDYIDNCGSEGTPLDDEMDVENEEEFEQETTN